MRKGPPADPSSITSYAKTKGQNRSTVRRKLRQAGIDGPIDPGEADRLIEEGQSMRYKSTTTSSEAGPISYNEAERRLKLAKAKQEELKLKRIEGTLVLRSAVEAQLFAMVRQSRDSLQNISSRIAGLVAAEPDQERCFTILSREINAALEGLTTDLDVRTT